MALVSNLLGSPHRPAERAAFDARRLIRGPPHRPVLLSCTFDVRYTWLQKNLIVYKIILKMLLERTVVELSKINIFHLFCFLHLPLVPSLINIFGISSNFVVCPAPSGNVFIRIFLILKFNCFFTLILPRSNRNLSSKVYWHGIFVNKKVFTTFQFVLSAKIFQNWAFKKYVLYRFLLELTKSEFIS